MAELSDGYTDDELSEFINLELDISRQIAIVERSRQDWHADRIAAFVLRKMDSSKRRRYLELLLCREVRRIRRARVHEIEKEAQRQAEAERRQISAAALEKDAKERKAEAEIARSARYAVYEKEPWRAPRHSRWFKSWALTPAGQKAAANERERQAVEKQRRDEIKELGVEGWYCQHIARIMDEFKSEVRHEARLELTRELLGSEFALGDGRTATWGDATVAEHFQRIKLLLRNVNGNLATIQRHRIAVHMINEAGASSLREISVIRQEAS